MVNNIPAFFPGLNPLVLSFFPRVDFAWGVDVLISYLDYAETKKVRVV